MTCLGIHVSSEEVLRLREVAEKAEKKKHSIIFLPCHRSHIDYVSLQIICYRLGIGLTTVVAGENLNIPVLGSFLQHAGELIASRILVRIKDLDKELSLFRGNVDTAQLR